MIRFMRSHSVSCEFEIGNSLPNGRVSFSGSENNIIKA